MTDKKLSLRDFSNPSEEELERWREERRKEAEGGRKGGKAGGSRGGRRPQKNE